jgi:hypothetical protein
MSIQRMRPGSTDDLLYAEVDDACTLAGGLRRDWRIEAQPAAIRMQFDQVKRQGPPVTSFGNAERGNGSGGVRSSSQRRAFSRP